MAEARRRITVAPVGGLGEMGHHHLALDLGPDSFLLDCGVLFPGPEDPGVDRILPPFDVACERAAAGRLRGLLLTHAHLDHVGAVRDLLDAVPGLPVYGTAFSIGVARRHLQEAGHSLSGLHIVHQGVPLELGEATITWHRVTHSLPSCSSVSVESPHGTVIHSGDFRIQDAPLIGEPTDLPGLHALGDRGVDLALVDSTGAGSLGRTLEERAVVDHLAARMAGVPGLVVLTTFGSHVERIVGIVEAARRVGRRVAIYGRSMETTWRLATELGLHPLKKGDLASVEAIVQGPRREGVVVVTGTQGEWRSPMARIGRGEDPLVKLGPGDFAGWSARVIPGNERAVGLVVDRLIRMGVDVQPPWGAGPKLHTSGHGRRDEIRRWLEAVRPAWVLPVHGTHWHLARHRDLLDEAGLTPEQVLRAESGDTLTLRPDSGDVEVDRPELPPEATFATGAARWTASEPALKSRRKLARTGGATAVLPWSPDGGGLADAPVVVTQGVFAASERAVAERAVGEELAAALAGKLKRADDEEIEEFARIALRQAVKRRTGTKVECRARIWRMVENVEV